MFRKIARVAVFGAALLLPAAIASAAEPLKIGVSAGPLAELLETVAGRAKANGQAVKIIEFQDWVAPNAAVFAGDIDANFFQHVTFLGQQNKARGFNLVAVDPAGVQVPVGLFSKKIKRVEDTPQGASVAIPNEPLNGARGLILLEKAGLIKLKPGKGINVTVDDITDNPKKLKIIQLDAAQTYRALDDVTLALVNLTYLIPAGGDPKSALVVDREPNEQFVLRFVARPDRRDDPRLRAFINEFKRPETRAFIEEKLPAFIPAI